MGMMGMMIETMTSFDFELFMISLPHDQVAFIYYTPFTIL